MWKESYIKLVYCLYVQGGKHRKHMVDDVPRKSWDVLKKMKNYVMLQ